MMAYLSCICVGARDFFGTFKNSLSIQCISSVGRTYLSLCCLYVSFGTLPGLFDNIHGLRSQKSSRIISKCSTTIRALDRRFLSFSFCVLDCWAGSANASIVSAVLWLAGSTSSYWILLIKSKVLGISLHAHLGIRHFLFWKSRVRYCSWFWNERIKSHSCQQPVYPVTSAC